jgi:DNA-binding LacI/PurR family transcriptional regulator
MAGLILRTHAEQVADFLDQEIVRGRWCNWMPGVLRLEKEIGVNRNTLEAALRLLEGKGVLGGGVGKRRRIEVSVENRAMRIGILCFDRIDRWQMHYVDMNHRLQEAGYASFFAKETICDMGMDVGRMERLVQTEEADVWLVLGGTEPMLKWFQDRGIPVFALFGRRSGQNVASVGLSKAAAIRQVLDLLVDMGHQRIVWLTHRLRRLPEPGRTEQMFLDRLKERGIPTGPYNMPDWDDTREGFHQCLVNLFRFSAPTAIIADEPSQYLAAMQFCGNLGLRVPHDISLVCNDSDPAFYLLQPAVTRIEWEPEAVIRQVLRWANEQARGKDIRRQVDIPATLVEGGTIGPVTV